jgi:hypothetical protein
VDYSQSSNIRKRHSSLQIPRHQEHFRPVSDLPAIPHATTPDGFVIVGWEVFLHDLHETHLFAPIIVLDEKRVSSSQVVFCTDCGKWILFGGTVAHYVNHSKRHDDYARRCRDLSDPQGVAVAFVSFLFQTGAPFLGIETLRVALPGQELPSQHQLPIIMQMLKGKVKETIRRECATALFVNLAMDGWTDPGHRKYQGITLRTVQSNTQTRVYLAAMKAVLPRHETGPVLAKYLENVVRRYSLREKLVNICTDRGSANVKAFHNTPKLEDFFCRLWIPCCCHLLNNFLQIFMREIRVLTSPIFRLSSAFRAGSRFRAYLMSVNAPLESIPSYTEIRWYSAYEMFRALDILWPHMVAFAEIEKMEVADLTEETCTTLRALKTVFAKFVKAQNQLESDSFGTGSTFSGYLMGVRYRVRSFKDAFGVKTAKFEQAIDRFMHGYETQWLVFVMQTILNPTVRLEADTPFDEETRTRGLALLTSLVEVELKQVRDRDAARARQERDDPSSDDFVTFRPSRKRPCVPAQVQVNAYLGLRETGDYDLSLWNSVRSEMVELRTVALKALSILTTSSSAERAFSVGALLCGDYQMAMAASTISARLLVQANWAIASRFVADVLGVGPRGWATWERNYLVKKSRFVPLPDPPPDPVRSDEESVYLALANWTSSDSDSEDTSEDREPSQQAQELELDLSVSIRSGDRIRKRRSYIQESTPD